MISSFGTIYLMIGLVVSMLVDQAYINKTNGHPDFIELEGSYGWINRIVTTLLWPIVMCVAVVLLIKRNKRNNDGA